MIIGARIKERLDTLNETQAALARAIGVSPQAVSKMVMGETTDSPKLYQIAKFLKTTPEYINGETDDDSLDAVGEKRLSWTPPVRDADDDTVEIEEVDMTFGMGATFIEGHVDSRKIRLSRSYLRYFTSTSPEHLFIATGVGDSMMPTIQAHEPVIVDRSKHTLSAGDKIWAIAYGNTGMIKRLRSMPDGSVKILSDNPTVPPEIAYDGELHIIGLVVGKGTKL